MKAHLALLVVSLVGVAPAAVGATSPPVRYAAGRLSAQLEGADLVEVLREVALQAGLEIRGGPSAPQELSIVLDEVPLAEGLSRLLAGQSFLLTYSDRGLRGVRLLGGGPDVGSSMVSLATPEAAAEWADAEPSGAQLANDRPVPIGGRLARALGADHTTFSNIVDVAMQNPESRVRADALRVAFRIVDAEPELRASVLDVLDHWNDVQLAGWLTHVAGDYAAEIVRRTARSARSGALRGRAQAVERIFEAGG